MEQAVPGNTERMAAGAAEGAARMAGAEAITFMVLRQRPRADTIIGRATEQVIEDGDMVMAALAVQYEGYVATVEYPFVAGTASDGQKRFLNALFEAANVQTDYLKAGVAGEMVRAVREVFRRHGCRELRRLPAHARNRAGGSRVAVPGRKRRLPVRGGHVRELGHQPVRASRRVEPDRGGLRDPDRRVGVADAADPPAQRAGPVGRQ